MIHGMTSDVTTIRETQPSEHPGSSSHLIRIIVYVKKKKSQTKIWLGFEFPRLPNSSLLVAIPLLSPARELNEQRINRSEQKKTPLSDPAVAVQNLILLTLFSSRHKRRLILNTNFCPLTLT